MDSGQAEGIFFVCLIKIYIINTHPVIFKNKDGIAEPIWVVQFLTKISV
jgi:hypothetical protein